MSKVNQNEKVQITNIIGADLGNSNLKIIWGVEYTDRIIIPNIVAPAPGQRPYFEPEKDPLAGLHVSINSKSIFGSYFVGILAGQAEEKEEVLTYLHLFKSESPQHLIILLTGLAYQAALTVKRELKDLPGEIKAKYYLGTSLPVPECKDSKAQSRFKKLLTGTHYVEFLQTPGLEGLNVEIQIIDVKVGLEGVPALLALTTNFDGSLKNEEVLNSNVLMADIGGGSIDLPIITPDGVMNSFTDGTQLGVNYYLDQIIEAAAIKGIRIKNRFQLINYLVNGNYEVRQKGILHNIKDIADEQFEKLAKKVYKVIDGQWSKMPEIDYCYLVGGGPVILKPYIKEINEGPGKTPLPLRFCANIEESIWLNALGSLIAANSIFGEQLVKAGD